MLRQSCFHRGGDAQRLVNPADVVVHEVQRDRVRVVLGGEYFSIGKKLTRISFTFGSSSVAGSGVWTFTQPSTRRLFPPWWKAIRKGNPDPRHISTSFVERQNLTMRMSMRRFTRLTNGFSKKAENHAHAVALRFMHYNFCRIEKTLRVTPAMEAGLAQHPWTIEELVGLLEAADKNAA
jgi:hypothetical protein